VACCCLDLCQTYNAWDSRTQRSVALCACAAAWTVPLCALPDCMAPTTLLTCLHMLDMGIVSFMTAKHLTSHSLWGKGPARLKRLQCASVRVCVLRVAGAQASLEVISQLLLSTWVLCVWVACVSTILRAAHPCTRLVSNTVQADKRQGPHQGVCDCWGLCSHMWCCLLHSMRPVGPAQCVLAVCHIIMVGPSVQDCTVLGVAGVYLCMTARVSPVVVGRMVWCCCHEAERNVCILWPWGATAKLKQAQ